MSKSQQRFEKQDYTTHPIIQCTLLVFHLCWGKARQPSIRTVPTPAIGSTIRLKDRNGQQKKGRGNAERRTDQRDESTSKEKAYSWVHNAKGRKIVAKNSQFDEKTLTNLPG